MKLAMLLALTASAATLSASTFSTKRPASAHIRQQTFHDRSPHVHARVAQPRHKA